MKTFITKTALVDRTLSYEVVPKGTECVSFGYKKFMAKTTWLSLANLGGFEGKMWEHLASSVGNCRFRIERHSENENQFNLVSIDRWRNGVKRMEVIHSWELANQLIGKDIEDAEWSNIQKDIWELPLFLRKRLTVDLGYSAKFDTVHNDSCEVEDFVTEG